MELSYTVETGKEFDAVVAAIEKASAANNFRVLYIHDVQNTLEGKGFKRSFYKIIEICNAGFAFKALEISPEIGLFMPCKINVYIRGSKTLISAMRPSLISEFFKTPQLKELADEVEKTIRSIVDESK